MATVEVMCRFCGEREAVRKYGFGPSNHQRYRCLSCRRTFQLEYTYRAWEPRVREQMVELAMNNAGIRDTARALQISINAVSRNVKNSIHAL